MRRDEPADERSFERARLLAVVVGTTVVLGGWLAWNAQVWLDALFTSLR